MNENYCQECGIVFKEKDHHLIEINGIRYCERCAFIYLKNYFKKIKKNT